MLKFIAISGTTEVTENLYIYETEKDMVIVDCGVGFPDLEAPGVDLVLPDFAYIIKNKNKLRGIVLTQGHEDHIGAVPFLLRDVKVPIWGSPLVIEFLKEKFKETGIRNITLNKFNPQKDEFKVGPFTFHPFRVTHSVPDTVGYAIDTPEGRVFHVAEHKMDQHPVDNMAFDVERAKSLAVGNPLFLASDCIGSNKKGFAPGELEVEVNMLKVIERAPKSVFATAISSNIGRFQQMINVALKTGRRVVFVGRSIISKVRIAHELGYISYPEDIVVDLRDAQKYPPRKLMFIVSGCFGQVGSSLYRLATGEYERLKINEGDMVVFSADPAPPYSKESEDFVIDQLIDKGVDVHYYELDEGLYASGHGRKEDIKALFDIVKPKFFIPIGGAIRYMSAYQKLVKEVGGNGENVFKLKPGENIIFDNGEVTKGETIPTRDVFVHGLGIGDIGKVVLEDRTVLGSEGVVVVIFKIDKKGIMSGDPVIATRGFVYEGKSRDFLTEASVKVKNMIKSKRVKDVKRLRDESINYLENYFFRTTGRRPMILPVVIEV